MRAEWPEERLSSVEILRRINAIDPDVKPIASVMSLRQWARTLGVVRPYAMIRNGQLVSACVRMQARCERINAAHAAGQSVREISKNMKIGRDQVGTIVKAAWRTAERRSFLLKAWPEGMETRSILAALTKMPGSPIPQRANCMSCWANDLGLRRPDGFRRFIPQVKASWKTPEREAVFAREWCLGTATQTIRASLAQLPGPPMPIKIGGMIKWAHDLKLERPPHYSPNSRIALPKRERMTRPAIIQREPVVDEAPLTEPPPEWPGEPIGDKIGWTFHQIRQWAAWRGVAYDGTNMDRINKMRAAVGKPLLLQVEW